MCSSRSSSSSSLSVDEQSCVHYKPEGVYRSLSSVVRSSLLLQTCVFFFFFFFSPHRVLSYSLSEEITIRGFCLVLMSGFLAWSQSLFGEHMMEKFHNAKIREVVGFKHTWSCRVCFLNGSTLKQTTWPSLRARKYWYFKKNLFLKAINMLYLSNYSFWNRLLFISPCGRSYKVYELLFHILSVQGHTHDRICSFFF